MVPYLFPETIDLIIDHLHSDKSSLFACSLTGRTWLPSSRYHLFSNTTLRPNDIESFSELLKDPRNNVAFVIQHLTVVGFEWIDYTLESSESGSTTILCTLPGITAHLPMVKSLALFRIDLTFCSPEILQSTLSDLSGIEALELVSLRIHGLVEAVDLLCAFPLLKTLSIADIYWKNHRLDPQGSIARLRQRPPFVVRFIDLHRPPPTSLTDWLLNPTQTIQTIQCHSVITETTLCLQQALASAGPSIQEIEVICNVDFGPVDTFPVINITNCTSIRSIRFQSIWLSPAFPNALFIQPILAQVSSPSFEELTFNFTGVDRNGADDWNSQLDWKGVAERLSRPQFVNLKRVCIEWPLSCVIEQADVESFLETGPFSPIMRRGLVQLKIVP